MIFHEHSFNTVLSKIQNKILIFPGLGGGVFKSTFCNLLGSGGWISSRTQKIYVIFAKQVAFENFQCFSPNFHVKYSELCKNYSVWKNADILTSATGPSDPGPLTASPSPLTRFLLRNCLERDWKITKSQIITSQLGQFYTVYSFPKYQFSKMLNWKNINYGEISIIPQ